MLFRRGSSKMTPKNCHVFLFRGHTTLTPTPIFAETEKSRHVTTPHRSGLAVKHFRESVTCHGPCHDRLCPLNPNLDTRLQSHRPATPYRSCSPLLSSANPDHTPCIRRSLSSHHLPDPTAEQATMADANIQCAPPHPHWFCVNWDEELTIDRRTLLQKPRNECT